MKENLLQRNATTGRAVPRKQDRANSSPFLPPQAPPFTFTESTNRNGERERERDDWGRGKEKRRTLLVMSRGISGLSEYVSLLLQPQTFLFNIRLGVKDTDGRRQTTIRLEKQTHCTALHLRATTLCWALLCPGPEWLRRKPQTLICLIIDAADGTRSVWLIIYCTAWPQACFQWQASSYGLLKALQIWHPAASWQLNSQTKLCIKGLKFLTNSVG